MNCKHLIKKIVTLCFAILITAGAAGQALNVQGIIFDAGGNRVPFATVCYYNFEDTTKLEFIATTNLAGQYLLQNMQNGKYIAKITAPGYQPKRQELQYRNVEYLAANNNGRVWAIIEMTKSEEPQVKPTVYMMKDLINTDEDTVEKIVERLIKAKDSESSSGRKNYRVWLGGTEVLSSQQNELKTEPVTKLSRKNRDKELNKSYIEYYDLSEHHPSIDGIFNIVFNNKSKPQCSVRVSLETTDFFIKK